MNIAELASKRDELREKKRELEAEVKKVNTLLEGNEQELIEAMQAVGIDKTQVGKLSLSISTQSLPAIDDWEAFHRYILDTGYLHLLHRRVSSGAYQEAVELEGAALPGTNTVTKTRINMRKAN